MRVKTSATRLTSASGGWSEWNFWHSAEAMKRAVAGCAASMSSTCSPSFSPPSLMTLPSTRFSPWSCFLGWKVNAESRLGCSMPHPVKARAVSVTSAWV